MIDLVKLKLQAGDGGHGKISFRREKYVPKGGPDGGRGGNGGHVILRLNPRMSTLQHLVGVKSISAPPGEKGGKRQKFGGNGANEVIEVPPGTLVWLLAENDVSRRRRERYGIEWLIKRSEAQFQKYFLPKIGELPVQPYIPDEVQAVTEDIDVTSSSLTSLQKHNLPQLIEITTEHPEIVVAQGGFGGRGNESFKGSTNTTPLEAEYGSSGEVKTVILELRLLADVGLIGFPNAGKSTLLSRLTHARPKIASYPFTTLEPQLGVMSFSDGEAVVADIPGVVEDAHTGKGLGLTFLKHIEHCRVLVFVLALTDEQVFDETTSTQEKAEAVWHQLVALRHELESFNPAFLAKTAIVSVNKLDIYSPELLDAIKVIFKREKNHPVLISAVTGEGLESLTHQLQEAVSQPQARTGD